MLEQKWKLIVTRRLNVFRVFIMAEGSQKEMDDYLGFRADAFVVTRSERSKYYLALKDLKSIGGAVLSKIKSNPEFPKIHAQDCKNTSEALVNEAKKVSSDINEKISNKELADRLKNYVTAHHKFVPFMVIPVAIEQGLTKNISEYILQKKSEPELEKYLNLLTTLPELPEVMKEQRELLSLAINLEEKSLKDYRKPLDEHVQKYQWLGCYNPDEPSFTYEHFEDRLKELLNRQITELKDELKNAENLFRDDQEQFKKTVEELQIDGSLLGQLQILRNYVYLRTYRIEMQSKSYFWIKGLFNKIAERIKIDLRTLGGMSPQEIYTALENDEIPANVEERIKNNVLHSENGLIKIYLEQSSDTLVTNELGVSEDKSLVKEISGTTAYKGKVTGIVRILYQKDQIKSFKEGEILVTSMTTPEFVPAMKKASAIVTDEGGVLCHAAIVSRELKKPCIIGTKIATDVLKDGDSVEVDANSGVVRILS